MSGEYPSFDKCTCGCIRHWHWADKKGRVVCWACRGEATTGGEHEFVLKTVFVSGY